MDKHSFLWKCFVLMAIGCAYQVYGDTCNKIDSCTCEMSDGSGQVNLRSLGINSPPYVYDYAFQIADSGWNYNYNPCYGFYFNFYADLAIVQTDMLNTYGYDLGVQSSSYFNLTESSGLAIHYTASDTLRSSRVLLICESGTNAHNFEFVGELIVTEYDFILTSPCACPGACDDYGILPTRTTTTSSPSGGNNQIHIPDNIQVDVNHHNNGGSDSSSSWLGTDIGGTMIALIFHDLLLIIIIAAVVVIIWNTSWCNCCRLGNGSGIAANEKCTDISGRSSKNYNV